MNQFIWFWKYIIISLSTHDVKGCSVNFEYFQLDVLWYALLLLPNIILFMTCDQHHQERIDLNETVNPRPPHFITGILKQGKSSKGKKSKLKTWMTFIFCRWYDISLCLFIFTYHGHKYTTLEKKKPPSCCGVVQPIFWFVLIFSCCGWRLARHHDYPKTVFS